MAFVRWGPINIPRRHVQMVETYAASLFASGVSTPVYSRVQREGDFVLQTGDFPKPNYMLSARGS